MQMLSTTSRNYVFQFTGSVSVVFLFSNETVFLFQPQDGSTRPTLSIREVTIGAYLNTELEIIVSLLGT